MSRNRGLILFALLLLVIALVPAWAATTTDVRGKLLDKNDQPIADAQVTYTNLNSGRVYTAVTDKHGKYLLKRLPIGRYRVEAVAADGSRIFSFEKQVEETRLPYPERPALPQYGPNHSSGH